jgi:hypothetical protein
MSGPQNLTPEQEQAFEDLKKWMNDERCSELSASACCANNHEKRNNKPTTVDTVSRDDMDDATGGQ